MPRVSRTGYAILFLLRNSPMSGYDIKKSCEEFLGHFWVESFGQIYPMLARLEAAGAVEGMPGLEQDRRRRKTYRITRQGHRQLRAWLLKPATPPRVRDELLLKISCGTEIDQQVHIDHLEKAREEARTRLEELGLQEIAYLADYHGLPDLPYWLISLRGGKAAQEARLRWCDRSIATLKKLQASTADLKRLSESS